MTNGGGANGEDDGAAASQHVLLLEVGTHQCALRAQDVLEVQAMVHIDPLPGAPSSIEGVIDLRGTITPVLDLRRRLGLAAPPVRPDDRLVVVATADGPLALHVDAALDLHPVPAGTLDLPPAAAVDHASGLVRLPTGLVMIHDLDAFLTSEEETLLRASLAAFRT